MIFGKLELAEHTLHTHRDSYVLSSIQGGVSVRLPLRGAGLLVGVTSSVFAWSFGDILYPGELVALCLLSIISLFVGLTFGQLQIVSRDLQGTRMTDAIWGSIGHLNRARREIANAIEMAKSEVAP